MNASKPLRAVLTVVQGESERLGRTLQWGLPVQPFSVGARGDWAIRGTGALDTHFYLAFDGRRLRIAAASEQARVVVHGKAISERWMALDLPLEIGFGEARLGAHAAVGARSPWSGAPSLISVTTELCRDDLGWTRTFPGLGAFELQDARRLPAARRGHAPSELSETRCDFGALGEHALRLEKAGSGAATAASTRRYLARLQRETSRTLPPSRRRPEQSGALGSVGEPAPGGVQSGDALANTEAISSPVSKPSPWRMPGMVSTVASASSTIALTLTELAHAFLRYSALARLRMTSPRRRRLALGVGLGLATLVCLHRGSRAVTSAPVIAPSALVTPAPVFAQGPFPAVPVGAGEPTARSLEDAGAAAGPLAPVSREPNPAPSEHATNEVQRAAFHATFSGDLRAASALYRELATGPDARMFELAARLADENRVRKP